MKNIFTIKNKQQTSQLFVCNFLNYSLYINQIIYTSIDISFYVVLGKIYRKVK